jgi:excisionase family DNA binding protein
MAAIRSTLNPVGTVSAIHPARIEGRQEKLLTAPEVAEWLGVSARWVLAHAAGLNRPVLPSVKLGKAVRFERGDVEEFIRQCARRYRAG